MTQGSPLIRLYAKGSDHLPARKTNPEGWQVARIGRAVLGFSIPEAFLSQPTPICDRCSPRGLQNRGQGVIWADATFWVIKWGTVDVGSSI